MEAEYNPLTGENYPGGHPSLRDTFAAVLASVFFKDKLDTLGQVTNAVISRLPSDERAEAIKSLGGDAEYQATVTHFLQEGGRMAYRAADALLAARERKEPATDGQ